MAADIEMLPLPEWMSTFIVPDGGKEVGCDHRLSALMKDYARANVAHATAAKDAEIEALRAEARDLRKRQAGWERHVASAGCEYVREGERDVLVNRRAERLAEALRLIAAPKRQDGTWNRDREACRQIAAEALRDHDQEVGNG